MTASWAIASNTIIQGVGKLITASVSFLVLVIVARAIGDQGLGDYAKVFAIVELFYLIVDFGFNAVVVKQIKLHEEKTHTFVATLFTARLLLTAVIAPIVLLLIWLLPTGEVQGFSNQVKIGIAIGALTLLTQAVLLTGNALFQARLRYDLSVAAVAAGALTKLVLVFIATFFSANLLSLVLMIVISDVVMALVVILNLKKRLGWVRPSFNLRQLSFLWYQSWPLGLALIFTQIYFRIDTVLLGIFRSSQEVAYYHLAYRFFDASLVPPIFFVNALYPILIKHYQQGLTKLLDSVKKALTILVAASLGATFLVIVFAPLIVRIFFGESFLATNNAVMIFAVQLPIFYISSLLMWLVIILGQQKLLVIFYGSGALINIGLNLLLIPKFGYLAAAVITGLSELYILLLLGCACFITIRKLRKLSVQ